MGKHSKRIGKRLGCAAIVSAAVVTLGLSVHHDVQFTASVTSPTAIEAAVVGVQQEECLYRAIRTQVPKGAAVYIDGANWMHAQRLAELSTPWAVPQATPATARWRLSIVYARGHCYGEALEVRRL
jgi:hypothetical protein